ncbi:hypothetical protein ACFWU3_25170 [Streptomyces sp. NPDC058685]|uniref:hypothetical protein n=1 Tax=Streptomyces sp. NPDC058685 TaxID=3346598 RepID=UPI00365FE259
MDRVRIAFGLLVVVIGTVWLLGGGTALRSGGRRLLVVLPYALIAFGLLLVLRAALPRGLLTAPLALIAGGGLWAAYDLGYLGGAAGSRILPGLVIAAGAVVALAGGGGRGRPGRAGDDVPLRSYRSVLWPVRVKVAGAPELRKVGVGSYFGDARIDLAGAAFASDPSGQTRHALQVDVTVLFGRVELLLDARCVVVKGNVESSPAVHFAEQVPVHVTPPAGTARHIVLNVLGVGGSVAVRRG